MGIWKICWHLTAPTIHLKLLGQSRTKLMYDSGTFLFFSLVCFVTFKVLLLLLKLDKQISGTIYWHILAANEA